MYKINIDKIIEGVDIRQNLLDIKNFIKDDKNKRQLAYYLKSDYGIFLKLLDSKDAKIRRNAVLILGELEDDELINDIFKAYKKEKTLFIRADYLKAISKYDYNNYINEMKERLEKLYYLLKNDIDNAKHYNEEIRWLRILIYDSSRCEHHLISKIKKTEFCLSSYPGTIKILVNILKKRQKRISLYGAMVKVFDTSIEELSDIRLYKEIFIPIIDDAKYLNVENIIHDMKNADIIKKLRFLFDGNSPFTYRLQIRGAISDNVAKESLRKLSDMIDKEFPSDLVNNVNDYQIEIKVIFKSTGNYAIFIRPMLILDERFSYRKKNTSESIKPVLAATICEYISPYIKEKACIFDPFCGSGILLIERAIKLKTDRTLGVDILDLAIDAAKVNANVANIDANFICKNFFDFNLENNIMVDEVISDLPKVTARKNFTYISKLYKKFFDKIYDFIKINGYLFLYTDLPEVLEKSFNEKFFEIIDKMEIRKNENAFLFVIKKL